VTRVLLIADRAMARHEHRLLNRLDVGLSDEGVRVTLAAPAGGERARRGSLSEILTYDPPAPFATTRARAARLVEQIGRPAGGEAVIVHAWGEGCWTLAVEVAAMLHAPLVVEVWAARLVRRLPAIERRARRRAALPCMLFTAPSTGLRDAIDAQRVRTPVRLVHWGVYAHGKRPVREEAAPPSVAILALGADPLSVDAALEGVAAIAAHRDDLLVLLDDRAVRRRPPLWQAVRDAGLLDNLTLVADMEAQREAVLEADVLLQPEATGEIRSITLEALASGMVVVAQRDTTSDTLTGDSPAILLEDASSRAWERAVRDALADQAGDGERAGRGLEFVRKSRRASDQIAALLRIYDGLTSPRAGAAPSE
jgi:glycosyltransferase involved in cell wall biosynthesis